MECVQHNKSWSWHLLAPQLLSPADTDNSHLACMVDSWFVNVLRLMTMETWSWYHLAIAWPLVFCWDLQLHGHMHAGNKVISAEYYDDVIGYQVDI